MSFRRSTRVAGGNLQLFREEPKRWLFAFTHPDDEISICAWMRRLIRCGAEVWVGWSVTNPTREREAEAAMMRLGIPREHLLFGKFPDGDACDHLPALTDFWRYAIGTAEPDCIALGAFECGHLDHDSTNFAVSSANTARLPQLEIPFYHTYVSRVPIMNRFADSTCQEILQLQPEEQSFKRRFSRMYPSQNIARLLVWYTLYGWVRGNPPKLCQTERMRTQQYFDFTVPNLPSALREKVVKTAKWSRWLRAVEKQQ